MKFTIRLCALIMAVFMITGVANGQQKSVDQGKPINGLAPTQQSIHHGILPAYDLAPRAKQGLLTGSKAMFDLMFSFTVPSARATSIETDGSYFYASRWDGSTFYRYTMAGALVDSFSITGVTGVRDLAYDGQYFYGGAAGTAIYQMNFTAHTLVATITCPAGTGVRHIAYDGGNDAFWVGNWDDDFKLISRTGVTLATIPAASHGLAGAYGSAFDPYSPGGPYLWIYDQSGTLLNTLYQINVSTGLPTGVTFDVTTVVPTTSGIAGGCFITNLINPAKAIIGGVIQNETVWGLELKDLNVFPNDVSPTVLVAPTSNVLLTATDDIIVTVRNLDTVDRFKIPISYTIDGGAAVNDTIFDTIPGQGSVDFTFLQTGNFSIPGKIYELVIYTHLAGDGDTDNDTLEVTLANVWDVAPVSLDGPSIIGAGSAALQATVENLGTMTATFDVTLDISDGFTSTKTVTNLAPGATIQVTFDPWTAVVGDYGVILTTVLAADSVPANNVLNDSIHVAELTKAYCYVAYDATLTLPEGPALTSLELPGVVTSLADQTGTNFIGAGTWGHDVWYGAVYTDNTLVSIDTLTGARTTIGTIGVAVSGMAYNYFNDVLYAIDWDGAATNLYTVNTTSGVGTLVGNCTSQLLINLACSKTGILYAASITDDNLYTVNATTGAVSLVGPLGFDAAYAQDMEFDHNNDKLYMAAYNGTSGAGELREVNVTNGSSILIGEFLAGAEITGFAIPGEPTYNNIDAGVQAITTPASGNALTATETITVIVANYGLTDINSGLSVSYVFDGGAPVTQAISSPLLAGTTTTVAFTTTVDLSVAGSNHTIVAYTTLATDQDHSNDTAAIAVQNTFGVYCVAGGGCDEYISNVAMGAINNTTTCSAGGYQDNTSINTPLEEGQTMTITVTNGNPYSTDECGIWVDWNSNGSFEDAGESYTIAGSPGNGPYSSGILAPAGTTLGDKRMRIRITYAQAPLPCGIDTYGEVEDYTIHLIAASGINDLNQEVAVNLFPNPVKEQLNIVCGATISTLRITNMYGALISSYDVQAKQTTINTSNLSSGMYYISLDTDQGTSVQKFIVE